MAQTCDDWLRRPDVDAVAAMCRFFSGDDPVHQTLRKIAARLDELGIAYAVAGGMALGAHRFVRTTVDVNILVTPEGLAAAHRELERWECVAPFAGSKQLKETATGVRYVALPTLVELKLASGMTNPGHMKDLADAQELIRVLGLPLEFSQQLNPYVRPKYEELWRGLKADRGES